MIIWVGGVLLAGATHKSAVAQQVSRAGSAQAAQAKGRPESLQATELHSRSSLPMPNTVRQTVVTYDAKSPDTKLPPIPQIRPPEGAPNVLIVLIDDVGFGASSTFGGPCQTPTLERLAQGGLRYTRFHTTAVCSASRQALLTGRNHHSVGMGGITETATGAPGYSSVRPNSMAPLALTLTLNGYSSAQFGKCHEVPVWQTSPVGPFDAWPSGAVALSISTGSLAGKRTSGIHHSTKGPRRSRSPGRRSRAITCWTIWPTRPSSGSASRRL